MERIKQALDRARKERKEDTASMHGMSSAATPAKEFQYDQTRTVPVNSTILKEHRIVTAFGRNPFTDAYKILRTQILQQFNEHDWKALAITSPGAGEGKTLTAINLAASIALEVDYTVLLVEANLLHPNMHEFFGLQRQKGLSDYLLGEAELPELLFQPSGIEHMTVLLGGRPLPNSAELLNSAVAAQFIEELKDRYSKRIVIFDLPPVIGTADVVAFTAMVDATLLVIEESKTREQDVLQAVKMLERAEIIGTVLNKVPSKP